jgi:hypothetical protein
MTEVAAEAKVEGKLVAPEVGTHWTDKQNGERWLVVREVLVGDPLGREVRGVVRGGNSAAKYATDLPTFFAVWSPVSDDAVEES